MVAVAAGLALVRVGWGGRRWVAVLGWLAAALALGWLAVAAGAWGATMGAVAGMAAALASLLASGGGVPARPRAAERERTAALVAPAPLALVRRLSVFLLVVPVGGAAALWLCFGLQAAMRGAGMAAADANACMFLLPPLVWCVLLAWQMTRDGPRRMIAAPLLAAAGGSVLWAIG